MTEWIVTSSAIILIVIAMRGLLKGKISLKLQYGLWALVLIRLLIPFSIADSAISIANILSTPTITEADNALADYKESIDTIRNDYIQRGESLTTEELRLQALEALQNKTHAKLEQEYAQAGSQVQNPQVQEEIRQQAQQQVAVINITAMVTDALPYLWLAGVVLVGAVLIGSNLHFGWKLRRSRKELDLPHVPAKVYLTDYVATPCLFGIGKPDIYLTNEVMEDSRMRTHVLAHEMSHYRQGDHIWSVLRCLCLVLHWYNPLVWVAAILSKQDAELACDEATIKALGETERTAYGRTLIGMTCVRRDPRSLMLTATTMLGTKKTLKERILLIARKPQMALYTLVTCILVAAIAVGCTFTGAPTDPTEPTSTDDEVWERLSEAVDAVNSTESRHFSHYILAEHPGKVYLENATPVNEGWVYGEDFYLGNTEPSQLYYDGTFYARRSDGTWLVDRYPEDDAYGFDISLPSRNDCTMTWTQTEEYLDLVLQSNTDKYDSYHYRMDSNGKLLWYAQTIQGSVTPGTAAESGPIALYSVYYLHDTDPANVREKVETSAAEILANIGDIDSNTEDTEPNEPYPEPSEPNPDLQKFQNLLTSEDSYWYWRAMGTIFEETEDISLKYIFYNGLKPEDRLHRDTFTDNEVVFLKAFAKNTMGDETPWRSSVKMPREYVSNVLEDYFGVSLEDVTIPEDWTYFAETDSYYCIRLDAYGIENREAIHVESVHLEDNGLVYVYWTTSRWIMDTRTDPAAWLIPLENKENVMMTCLRERADGSYVVLSNVPYSEENPVPHITDIVDRVEEENLPSDTALELFFADTSYRYYFPTIRSQYITVYFSDGSSENIITALQTERATIADLDTYGIRYIKNPVE